MALCGDLNFFLVLLSSLLLSVPIPTTHGFNLDLQAPVVQSIPEIDSYFGYSVAMHRENGINKMLVGAPQFESNSVNENRTGALFSCPVTPYTNPDSCEEITQLNDHSNDVNEQNDPIASRENQWLGATVRSSGVDGTVLACRPLYTWFTVPDTSSNAAREPIGGCYVATENFANIRIHEPCRSNSEQNVFGIGHCQAGIGADISEDEILLGAPGSFFWQGQIWVSNLDLGRERRTNEGHYSFDDSYRGYSVAIGDFSGDSRPEYAVGIPRARTLLGMVSIYDGTMNAYLNITGTQFGAYFGHTVIVSDFNDDGLNDLVVSAPFFIDEEKTTDGWEIGRVHIYYNDANGGFSDGSIIVGYGVRSRFGSAMAALSDVNQDGYNDLAISAPYGGTGGKGAVYIYHGMGTRGLPSTYSQVLEPSSFGLDITTFGYSLSAGLDLDENQYPDLLVGAYQSATVVLVRSRPIISATATLSTTSRSIDLRNTTYEFDNPSIASFNLSVCIRYTGVSVPATEDIEYTAVLDYSRQTSSRALFALDGSDVARYTGTMTAEADVDTCHVLPVYVQSTIRDKLSPISISLNFGLPDSAPGNGSILPILDQNTNTYTTLSLPITRDCMNQTCIPNLNVQASTTTAALRVGASESVTVDVTVTNSGEDAYLSTLDASLPEELQYVGFEKIQGDSIVTCTSQSQTLIGCDVGNPFKAGATVKMSMMFSSDNMPGNRDSLSFKFRVGSVDKENVNSDNEFNVTLSLLVTAELSLYGSTNPEKVIYDVKDYATTETVKFESQIGPEVTHVISLYNNGPSRIGRTVVSIEWPMSYGSSQGGYLLYPISASMDTGDYCTIEGGWNPANVTLNGTESSDITVSASRRRRRAVPAEPIATVTTPPFKEEIGCGSGNDSNDCADIACAVDALGAGINAVRNSITITLRSRVWSDSITVKDASVELSVSIQARANVYTVPYTTLLARPIEATSNMITNTIHPQVSTIEIIKEIPWWQYFLSALAGLIILIFMIFILYKVGFFKRKKVTDEQKQFIRSKSVSRPAKGEDNPMVERE